MEAELRQELARLQEREAELTHLLQLERERRVRAEQDSEIEKQACLELGQLLSREKQLRATCPTSPSQMTLVPSSLREEEEEMVEEEKEGANLYPAFSSHTTTESKITNDGGIPTSMGSRVLPEENEKTLELPSLGFNFSSSVFSQLPNDLQEMLGICKEPIVPPPPSKHTLTKAMEAVKVNDSHELEQCVVSLGKELLEGADGQGLLELACEQGHTGCVRVLLHGGCSPGASSREDGMAPTHLAARNGHLDSLRLLLEWGVSASQQDKEGHTPLFLALCEGHKGCADRLLHAGSSLQAVTKSGYTTIHAAVSGNLPNTLRVLLVHLRTSLERSEVTQVVNYTDKDGSTALHFAASRGYKSCVEVLCASPEVDIGLRDRWNRTALDISTVDCKELLQTKDHKQVVVIVERKHPHGSDQLSSVVVGKITVLKHHKLSDIEPLVDEALKQYSNSLSGHRNITASDNSLVLSTLDPQHKTYKSGGNSLSKLFQKELHKNGEDCDLHLSVLKDSLCTLSRMDLSGRSIASYRIGNFSWKAQELFPSMKSKNLFGMFGEAKGTISRIGRSTKTMEVTVTLKGAAEGCVDQLAFDLMFPVAKLREYVEMIEDNQTIMLYGPQGSGKTFLAKSLAEFIKCKHDSERVQIIHVSLHPGFKRDDLFRLLHLNSLLVPQDDQERDIMKKESKSARTSTLQPKSHVVILDDMDQVSTPSVLAELLTALEYRGPYYPVWVDAVYSRQDGTLLYPAGHYYLKEKCYFIATRAHASGEGLQSAVMEQFVHVSLGLTGEPCSGVLHRHLMSRLIHSMHGDKPHRSDLLNKVVQWVWEVWQLYNHLMLRLNFPELTTGLRHILHCPVESSDPETVCSWLCNVWNQHLLPSIKTFLLSPRPYGGVSVNTHTVDNHHDNGHPNDSHHDNINHLVTLITQKVFTPTCPLDPERTIGWLKDLHGSLEITATSEEKRKCGDEDSPLLYTVNSCAVSSPPPRETKLPSNSMVAYEDMTAKSSPCMKANPPRPAPLRAVHPSDVAPLNEVTLRQNSNKKRERRIKSFSLFSKDGMASLPRLLRRNSTRTSVAEERPKKMEKRDQRAFSHDMEDVFNLLSSASSDRIDDQRSPIPLVPKYKVSTGSLQNKHVYSNGLTPDSPPAYSMPDLTADEYPTPSEDVFTQFELDMHPKSYSVVNLLDEESSSRGRGEDMPVPLAVRHLGELPSQPSSEPTKRRIHTSPLRNGVTHSSQSTPGASRRGSSPLTSPLTTAYTKTSPCAKSSRNTSPASAVYQYVNSRSKNMKAKSSCDLLSDDTTDLDLFRAASEGEIKPQTSDYVSDDGRTLQSDPNTSNLSTLSELDFDISGHFDRRASDACTSSTLFFSASLGFSPDSAIMKGTPPRDCSRDRLNNPRPSITMMDILANEEL